MSPVVYDRRIYLKIMTEAANASVRLTARVPQSIQANLVEAAALSGATLNQFLVQAAIEKADRILAAERTIYLSEREATKVFELIEQPPLPTAALQAAMKQHREFFGNEKS